MGKMGREEGFADYQGQNLSKTFTAVRFYFPLNIGFLRSMNDFTPSAKSGPDAHSAKLSASASICSARSRLNDACSSALVFAYAWVGPAARRAAKVAASASSEARGTALNASP